MTSYVASGQSVHAPNPTTERGNSVSFDASSDGRKIAYVSGYAVVLRDVDSPEVCQVYTECKRAGTCVRFSPDGSLVAVGDCAGSVFIFDSTTLATKKELMILGAPIADLAFDAQGKRILAVGDGKVNARCVLWESGSNQGEIAGATKRMLSCSISPCGKFASTASEDGVVRKYQGPPYKFVESFNKHTNFVQGCRYSPCGKYLATCSSDKCIFILETETNNVVHKLEGHAGSVFSISWHSDGTKLVSASGDKSVKLWNITDGTCAGTVTAGRDIADMQVGCVFAGDKVLSVSLSGDINYIDFDGSKISKTVTGHTGTPSSVACVDGNLYVGGSDGNVYSYSSEGVAHHFEGIRNPKPCDGIVAKNGKLYSVAHDDTLRIADLQDGVYKFAGATCSTGGTPCGLAVGNADPSLVTVILENTVLLIRDGRILDSKPTTYKCTCVAMSPDCNEVLVGATDRAVHIFEVSGGNKLVATSTTMATKNDGAASITYSPDGSLIAVGESSDEVSLWEAATKKPRVQGFWKYHGSKVLSVAFSPSGGHIASCGTDGIIMIWNSEKKLKKLKMERTHAMGVNSVAWLNETTVVSAGNDGCIRKWEPALP